ncbi:MAG: riboflavin synthase [Phycisphaerales bacterium]|nr:riboflavin synthase [Phycisphaerales bacterium]
MRQVQAKGYVMFTGLVERIGTISVVEPITEGIRLGVICSPWDRKVDLGESICVAGCCLTVVEAVPTEDNLFLSFVVVPESLRHTTLGLVDINSDVNIERALRADGFLGGHQVQGHVDATESILKLSDDGIEEKRVQISMKNVDRDTIVSKGSITIDGVSLTIASVVDDWFEVALIPTTLQETTLGKISVGDKVNIETDIIARTVARVVRNMKSS